MKRIILIACMAVLLVGCLTIFVSASERTTISYTDANGTTHEVPVIKFENDTPENVASALGNNSTQQGRFKDDDAYVILMSNDNVLCAYPTWYIIEPSGSSASYIAVSEVEYTYINQNDPNGKTYQKGAVRYIEFPDGMTHMRNNGVFGRTSCYEKNVTDIYIPSSVTEIQDMAFSSNKAIKRVYIADDSQITRIGDDAFLDCTSLEHFDFEKLPLLTFIDGFNNCAALPDTIDLSGSKSLVEIGQNCFNGCKFTGVSLPDSIKYFRNGVFYNNNLSYLKLPANLEYIGDDALSGNTNMVLESGILPKNLNHIGTNFLYNCQNLPETIVFPKGVTSIPDEGFPGVSRPNKQGKLNIVFLGKMTNMIIDGSPYQDWAEQVTIYFAQNTISDFTGNVYSYTDKVSGSLGSFTAQTGTLVLDVSDRSVNSTTQVGSNFLELIFCGNNGTVEQSYVLTTTGNSITEDRGLFDMANHTHFKYRDVDTDCTSDNICIVCDVNFAMASHEFKEVIKYDNGFASNGVKSQACQNDGCLIANDGIVLNPIFVSVGFAMSENPDANGNYSIVRGYMIDSEAYEDYIANGNSLSYGFVVSVKRITGDEPLTIENDTVVAAYEGKTLVIDRGEISHSFVDLKVIGLTSSHNGEELIMSLFVFDGKQTSS